MSDNKSFKKSIYMKDLLELRDFQKEAIRFLYGNPKAILGLPTGVGKTITSFSLYSYHKQVHDVPNKYQLLFVTEKSLVPQSTEDLLKFFELEYHMIYGHSKKKRDEVYKEFEDELTDVLFLNYEILRNDYKQIFEIVKRQGLNNIMFIYDEATAIKSRSSKISKIIKAFTSNVSRSLGLTATLSKGRMEDYYNIMHNLNIPIWTYRKFQDNFILSETVYWGFLKNNQRSLGRAKGKIQGNTVTFFFNLSYLDRAKLMMKAYPKGAIAKIVRNNLLVLSVKLQYASGQRFLSVSSGKKTHPLTLFMTSDDKTVGYKNVTDFVKGTRKYIFTRSKKSVASELPAFSKKKIILSEDKETIQTLQMLYYETKVPNFARINIALSTPEAINKDLSEDYISPKINEMLKLLTGSLSTEKVLVYSHSRQVIERAYTTYHNHTGKDFAVITGNSQFDSNEQRHKFWEDSNINVLFGTDSMSQGHNLQNANYIIYLNLPLNSGNYIQTSGRISRIGTEHSNLTLIHLLYEDTADIDWYEMVHRQLNLINTLNPDQIDEGLLASDVTETLDEKDIDTFVRRSLGNRRKQYVDD
ncbi:DNA/RNA helicase, superfamily II, SNF2 family [Thiovulum sp. ES]|nr:DNA/RNA helicase, superfamily II, SNF2 family [Thiovulum sp. ES]